MAAILLSETCPSSSSTWRLGHLLHIGCLVDDIGEKRSLLARLSHILDESAEPTTVG